MLPARVHTVPRVTLAAKLLGLDCVHPAMYIYIYVIASRGELPISGTRKMVLRRMVPKDKIKNSFILKVEMASCPRKAHQERWGRSPPPFLMGFRRQEAVSIHKIGEIWFLSFGTIRRSTILRVPDFGRFQGLCSCGLLLSLPAWPRDWTWDCLGHLKTHLRAHEE